jgi:hypothetical protein
MPAGYPDFSWSVRVVRMLVVVAVAALSGAVIGGAGVYLISDALSPPPPSRAGANTGNAIVVSATPPAPSDAAPATASVTAEPPAATPPQFDSKSESRAQPDTAAVPETDTQPTAPAPRAADARAPNTDENRVASKPARQRTVTRARRPAAQGFAPSAVARTPIYDYYGQGVDRAQRRPGQSLFGSPFGRDADWQRDDRNRQW